MPGNSGLHLTLAETPWAVPIAFPAKPQAGEVHLWRAALSLDAVQTRKHYELLSPDEQQRAARFHYPEDRDHFINARGTLRSLLGLYLNLPAAEVAFSYTEYGKPDQHIDPSLSFNVSHAGGHGLFGFTADAPIGVDLEKTDKNIEVERLTSRFFSPIEASIVLSLSTNDRPAAFFRTWTRKEAFIKAHGEGLNLPLDQFAVTVALEETVRLQRIDWAPKTVEDWSLVSFMVREELPAAMVIREESVTSCFFNWKEE